MAAYFPAPNLTGSANNFISQGNSTTSNNATDAAVFDSVERVQESVASGQPVAAAHALVSKDRDEPVSIPLDPEDALKGLLAVKPGRDDYEGRRATQVKIEELQGALVERARTDLGLDLALRVPPGSLLGQMLGRRYR